MTFVSSVGGRALGPKGFERTSPGPWTRSEISETPGFGRIEREGMGRRLWMGLGMVLLAGTLAPAEPAMAQDQAKPRIGCFRGKPLPDCKSFWIVEIQGVLPAFQTRRTITYVNIGSSMRVSSFSNELEWNLGHMVNVDGDWALGGELTLGTGRYDRAALRVRGRRWLNPDVSVEAEAGVRWSSGDYSAAPATPVGPTLGARLNIRDQGAFFVRWDAYSLPEIPASSGYDDPGGTQHALSVGVAAGSVPGLAATGAVGLGLLVLISSVNWD